ncbi:MAG: type I polyketide synthase, partial [Verrucomicrobiota bacterium]
GTALVERAVRAGDAAGCALVEELTVQGPLVLPLLGAARVQVMVEGPGQDGRRGIEIYSRPGDAAADGAWTRHAAGVLAPAAAGDAAAGDLAGSGDLAVWPPPGAVEADCAGLYERLAGSGYGYGPAFRGLRAAWHRDGEVFAEVALPEGAAADAAGFGLHPALLDAVLHAASLGGLAPAAAAGAGPLLPWSWAGVRLHAAGAAVLRARLRPGAAGTGLSVLAADPAGVPVITVASLVLRPAGQGGITGTADALFAAGWTPLPAPAGTPAAAAVAVAGQDWLGLGAALAGTGSPVREYPGITALAAAVAAGDPAPQIVLACAGIPGDGGDGGGGGGGGDAAAGARAAAGQVLGLVQDWLAAGPGESRLVLVTRGAAAVLAGEGAADLGGAAARGLAASAQSEHPGRVVLADLPAGHPAAGRDIRAVLAALAGGPGEPDLAVRGGTCYGRRLTRPAPAPVPDPGPLAGGEPGTVLVTGGTGMLGALAARHLAAAGRARVLLLASRSGPAAPGVPVLAAALAGAGAGVRVAVCDTGDRAALGGLLGRVPARVPLTGVIHAAGVIDDATVASLTPARVGPVMRAKADGAWHLHELTRGADLQMFVLYSSAAAAFGSAGQGNYAAANAFLDALAGYRRSRGLPAVSVGWGLWARASALTGHLTGEDRARITRGGMIPLTAAEGLALLDAALDHGQPCLIAARLDLTAIRAAARAGTTLPPLWHTLAGSPARPAAASAPGTGTGTLRARLAPLTGTEQLQVLAELVREHAAAVLGHGPADAVEPGRAFRDLGFDSLTAVEFRNRLAAAAGLRLPATLVFDYPTPVVLAGYLRAELGGDRRDAVVPVRVAGAATEPVVIVGMGCR